MKQSNYLLDSRFRKLIFDWMKDLHAQFVLHTKASIHMCIYTHSETHTCRHTHKYIHQPNTNDLALTPGSSPIHTQAYEATRRRPLGAASPMVDDVFVYLRALELEVMC